MKLGPWRPASANMAPSICKWKCWGRSNEEGEQWSGCSRRVENKLGKWKLETLRLEWERELFGCQILVRRDPQVPGSAKKFIFIRAGRQVDFGRSTVSFNWGQKLSWFWRTLLSSSPHGHVSPTNWGWQVSKLSLIDGLIWTSRQQIELLWSTTQPTLGRSPCRGHLSLFHTQRGLFCSAETRVSDGTWAAPPLDLPAARRGRGFLGQHEGCVPAHCPPRLPGGTPATGDGGPR